MTLPVVLPSELSPLDEALQQLAVDGYVEINPKKGRWDLTKPGIAYLGEHIDEATDLIDELDDKELADALAELRWRNLDLFRARYLWGWYDGEFDDLVVRSTIAAGEREAALRQQELRSGYSEPCQECTWSGVSCRIGRSRNCRSGSGGSRAISRACR